MVPDRDRANRAESRCAIDEPPIARQGNEHVVREFILLDDVRRVHGRLLDATPSKDIVEAAMPLHEFLDALTFNSGEAGVVSNGDSHALPNVRTTLVGRPGATLPDGSEVWLADVSIVTGDADPSARPTLEDIRESKLGIQRLTLSRALHGEAVIHDGERATQYHPKLVMV